MDTTSFPPPMPTHAPTQVPPTPLLPAPSPKLAMPGAARVAAPPTQWLDLEAVTPAAPTKRRRRRGTWVAGAMAVGAIVATTAVVLTRDAPAEAYSLTQAATQAQDARTLTYEMEMGMGVAGSATAEASFDLDRGLMSMTMSMDMVDQPVDALFDIGENTMYMSTAAFGDVIDAEWVAIDFEEVTGLDIGSMQQMTDNPLDVTEAFLAADDVEDLGFDEVNGQQVKHYRVTVDTAAVLAATPSLEETIADIPGLELPDTFEYDVYVTEANEMVRMAYEYEVMGQPMTIDLIVTGVNEPVDIQLPDPADVADIGDLGF